jgi:anti-sigma regulatory factor (Ser/Thr protein kinase)
MSEPLFQRRITTVEALPEVLDGLENTCLNAGWDPAFQMQLALVIEELMVNALVHGGQEAGQAGSEVILYGEAEGVKAVLQDNGLAFDPFSLDAPDTDLDLDSRAIGGLGVHLVRQMTESQHYEREGDRNRVTLFKRHEA